MIICQSNSRLVGYARVSTTDQELCLQIGALRQHGVKKEHLFCDKISGAISVSSLSVINKGKRPDNA